MSGQPAARLTDKITCLVPQVVPSPPPPPHAIAPGLPILVVGAPTVMIGGISAARVSDFSMCLGPAPIPNPILRGAFPVPIMMMPAARLTDQATHPGSLITGPCCPTVLIGLAGTTGNPPVGTQACLALGQNNGRTGPNPSGQSYNNCGIESSRQIINHVNGLAITENALMQTAKNTPAINTTSTVAPGGTIGVPGGPNLFAEGGTTAPQQAALLTQSGAPSSQITPLVGNNGVQLSQYELPLSQGRAIIAHGDVSGFPASQGYGVQPGMRGHAVTVTGMDYDDSGNITNVHFNDTNSMCGQTLTATQFSNFLNTFANRAQAGGFTPPNSVVTNNPVW